MYLRTPKSRFGRETTPRQKGLESTRPSGTDQGLDDYSLPINPPPWAPTDGKRDF